MCYFRMKPVYMQSFLQRICSGNVPVFVLNGNAPNRVKLLKKIGFIIPLGGILMDIYDCNEENLSSVAGSCRHHSYTQGKRNMSSPTEVSCSDCRYWNGRGCSRNQFDSIASELQLD